LWDLFNFTTVPSIGKMVGEDIVVDLELIMSAKFGFGLLAAVIIDVFVSKVTDVSPDIDVGTFTKLDTKTYPDLITALEYIPIAATLGEELSLDWGGGECSCLPTTARNCALQTPMPSCHVCLNCPFAALPHFPNQEPPWPQQLALPDLLIIPQAGQTELAVVVTTTGNNMWEMIKSKNSTATTISPG